MLRLLKIFLVPCLLSILAAAQTPVAPASTKTYPPEQVAKGEATFQQDCAFCHGREATGGESGPDLTRSRLVSSDVDGNKIAPVIKNGRPDKGMPPFDKSDEEIAALVAYIHTRQNSLPKRPGGRRGVDPSDLQTGNAAEGQKYFNGAGGCSRCHSATGDLAGIATRYQGLELEMRMLYPRDAKSKVTVTPRNGAAITGTLAYRDEFTIALTGADGYYHSFNLKDVQCKIDAPVDAHIDQFPKYTDDDIHNLMAYIQTLR